MQIQPHAVSASFLAAPPKPVLADTPLADTGAIERQGPPAVSKPLASNGMFDLAGLLSSDLVKDVIALAANGDPAFQDPGRIYSSQERLAYQEILSRSGDVATEGAPPANQLLTDDDKAFFRASTGYNFVTFENGFHAVVDDEGNPPKVSAAEAEAMGALGISLMGDRSSGRLEGEVSIDWFEEIMATYSDSDFPMPKDWLTEASDWFLDRSEEG